MGTSTCKNCGASILWLTLGNGEKLPLDVEKVPFVARGDDGKHREFEGRIPHWATCTNPPEENEE